MAVSEDCKIDFFRAPELEPENFQTHYNSPIGQHVGRFLHSIQFKHFIYIHTVLRPNKTEN